MLIDVSSLRLQYEILNKSAHDLADEFNVPRTAVDQAISSGQWVKWFPEPDMVINPDATQSVEDMEEAAENFITKSKQRLAIYNIAKEIQLAQKYYALEIKIINEANSILGKDDLDARTVKSLSALYVDMTKSSLSTALASMSFGTDDNGLPTVVIKDLSGQRK